MKSLVCLIYVFFVVICFGASLGNTEVKEDCRLQEITTRRAELQIAKELAGILVVCLNQSSNSDVRQLVSLQSIAEHQAFFGNLCNGLPTTRKCLAVESRKWTGCYNETMTKVYTIFDTLVEALLRKGCETGGDTFGIITEGYRRHGTHNNGRNDFVRECLIFGTERWMMVLRSNATLATKIWFLHRGIQDFKRCFDEHLPEESLVEVSNDLVDVVLDEMKCLNPKDENLVLCKSIDTSSIDRASACPIRNTNGDDLSPLSALMLLDRRLHSCFVVYDPYGMQFSNLTTIEQFREYFTNYCRRDTPRVKNCLHETTSAAQVCLDDPQFKNFKLVNGYLSNALESGCLENGTRLASIFHSVWMLRNTTKQQDAFTRCLTGGHVLNSQSYDDATRVYTFYKQLPVVRQCMIDYVGGDAAFIEDLNTFINDIITKMKCIDTQNGNIVLCNTIVEN